MLTHAPIQVESVCECKQQSMFTTLDLQCWWTTKMLAFVGNLKCLRHFKWDIEKIYWKRIRDCLGHVDFKVSCFWYVRRKTDPLLIPIFIFFAYLSLYFYVSLSFFVSLTLSHSVSSYPTILLLSLPSSLPYTSTSHCLSIPSYHFWSVTSSHSILFLLSSHRIFFFLFSRGIPPSSVWPLPFLPYFLLFLAFLSLLLTQSLSIASLHSSCSIPLLHFSFFLSPILLLFWLFLFGTFLIRSVFRSPHCI